MPKYEIDPITDNLILVINPDDIPTFFVQNTIFSGLDTTVQAGQDLFIANGLIIEGNLIMNGNLRI